MANETRRYGRPWTPAADIYETDEQVIIQVVLPGIKADQVDVQCDKGMLSIKGERVFSEKGKYYRVESVYGPFERYFEIPRTLDVSKVTANYQDGILVLTIPKAEEAKPKKIAISAS